MYNQEDEFDKVSEPEVEYQTERNKPMPSKNHSYIQIRLGAALIVNYGEQYDFYSELSLNLPNVNSAVPDICIFPKTEIDLLNDEIKVTEPPITSIEILSPKQGIDDLKNKIFDIYFPAGVQSAWIIVPTFRTVYIFTPDKKYQTFNTGKLTDPATGITLELDDFFP